MYQADTDKTFELSKKIVAKYPDIKTKRFYCLVNGSWDTLMTFETAQRGYIGAAQRLPAPDANEILEALGTVRLTADTYQTFKQDEWTFLAKQLLAKRKKGKE